MRFLVEWEYKPRTPAGGFAVSGKQLADASGLEWLRPNRMKYDSETRRVVLHSLTLLNVALACLDHC